jgi:hypothetical protein
VHSRRERDLRSRTRSQRDPKAFSWLLQIRSTRAGDAPRCNEFARSGREEFGPFPRVGWIRRSQEVFLAPERQTKGQPQGDLTPRTFGPILPGAPKTPCTGVVGDPSGAHFAHQGRIPAFATAALQRICRAEARSGQRTCRAEARSGQRTCRAEARSAKADRGLPTSSPSANPAGRLEARRVRVPRVPASVRSYLSRASSSS